MKPEKNLKPVLIENDIWSEYRREPTWADKQHRAAERERRQWQQAAQLLKSIAGKKREEAREVWRKQLDKLRQQDGIQWASEVKAKATAEIKKGTYKES